MSMVRLLVLDSKTKLELMMVSMMKQKLARTTLFWKALKSVENFSNQMAKKMDELMVHLLDWKRV